MQVADGAGINGRGALRCRVNGGNARVGPGEIWIESSEPPLAGLSAFVPGPGASSPSCRAVRIIPAAASTSARRRARELKGTTTAAATRCRNRYPAPPRAHPQAGHQRHRPSVHRPEEPLLQRVAVITRRPPVEPGYIPVRLPGHRRSPSGPTPRWCPVATKSARSAAITPDRNRTRQSRVRRISHVHR